MPAPTAHVLHWGYRSHADTTPAHWNHGLIVPVTVHGDATPEVLARLTAAVAAKSTATRTYTLSRLDARHGRYTSGPAGSNHVAHVCVRVR